MGLQYFFISCFGAIFGSFANVIILRLPEGKSVVRPASHCPKCKAKIKWSQNIPIVSWIFLKGKCSVCKNSISFRYPLVEIIMTVGFCALFWLHGWNFYLLEHLILYFGLVTVSFIDLDHMIIPDSFSLGGILIGLLGSLLNPGRTFLQSLGGILMGGGFLWAVAYFYYIWRKKEGMGGGDIKLLAWIGAVLGWKAIPFVILSSSLTGSIVGLLVSVRSKEGMASVIPFGPYLAFGAILYIFLGENTMNWYFGFFLPGL
ncbi:MAG: prepilin peptidase [Bdellovibrionaceae bacterium]|nr:prepilin peptidase [Pseudobdellovibrionaceae bacterium]